jgi:zinc transporter 1/2/3
MIYIYAAYSIVHIGVTANLVQGSFDAVSSGILLYVAFVQLMGVDFAHDYGACGDKYKAKCTLFICLWAGAAVMAVIGIWF